MKDGLRVLVDARPAELDPDLPVSPDVRRRELTLAQTRSPGAVRRGGARRRRVWQGLVAVAGVGVAAASAAVLLSPSDGRVPRPSGIPPKANMSLTARQVLLTAADATAAHKNTAGRYFHFVVTWRDYQPVVSPVGRYVVVDLRRQEGWFGVGDGVERIQDLGTRPVGPQDEAVWRKAGSPKRFRFRGGLWQSMAPGPVDRRQVGPDDIVFAGPIRKPAELAALPSDPRALKKVLLERRPASAAQESSTEYLFFTGALMSMETPLKPEIRASLLRMMAELPGITSLGSSTDSQGRTGAAVAMTIRSGATETSVVRLIIDTATGMPLARDVTVTSTAASGPGHLQPGQTVAETTLVSTDWTNTHP